MKIALAGNPNSGKTTLFNALTGKIEHVGNWPGVTVDKKEGRVKLSLKPQGRMIAVDLPGAYSISPYTSEESITRDFIESEAPDVIINIVDATNLNRSLFFTMQLLALNIPVVVALNKTDLMKKRGHTIHTGKLSQHLNCPVVEVSAVNGKNNGLDNLVAECRLLRDKKPQQIAPTVEGLEKDGKEQKHKAADKKRFAFVNKVVADVEKKENNSSRQMVQDKIDRIVAHKWLGIPIFIAVIWFIFQVSQAWVGPRLSNLLVSGLEFFQNWIARFFEGTNPFISALLIDGIIGGVIAVVGFLPLIMVMFFLMALFEDCGYMSRAAVVMDRFFKKIGLSGRSIIPMVIGTACGIPGVMSARTIKDQRKRRTTVMLAPFMPCGAKLPIIALFAGVFFSGNAWVGTSMYLLGILIIILSALIIRKITGDTSKSYFIMELPEYRIPSIKRATISMLSRAKGFIVKASTVILLCNAIIQIMQSFTWEFRMTEIPSDSILASIAGPVAILFIPLGFGIWQFAAAAVTGFIAKENVVGTLAVCFGIANFIDVEALKLVGSATGVQSTFAIGSVAALSYLVFNLFSPPCFACIGAIRSEMNSAKWTWAAVGFQIAVGYTLSFLIYQTGTLITTGAPGSGFFGGLIAVLVIVGIITLLSVANKSIEQKVPGGSLPV